MKRNFIQTLALALFAWVAAVAIARSEDSGEYFEKTFSLRILQSLDDFKWTRNGRYGFPPTLKRCEASLFTNMGAERGRATEDEPPFTTFTGKPWLANTIAL